MTALAEKMEKAGVDTLGAKLTTACIEGLRHWPNNPRMAWDYAFKEIGREFVMGLMADMAPTAASPAAPISEPPGRWITGTELMAAGSQVDKPRVIPPERLEKRRQLQQVVRSKYRNSADVPWSDVGWHELYGLKRDGAEATALLAAGPANVPNDGRRVGDVLSVQTVDAIIKAVRA